MSDSQSYSSGLSLTLRITVNILIILVFVIAFLDLIGWMFDITFLKSMGAQWVPMKIPTSLCFILASSALASKRIILPVIFRKVMMRVMAILMILISLATLFAFHYSISTGHESYLSEYPFLSYFTAPPYRMAIITAFNFLLIGFILILLASDQKITTNIAHILIIPVAIVSYFVLVSYIFGVYSATRLHGLPVALNSGMAFCGLCAAMLLIKPDSWLMEVFMNRETGGIFARKLLPGLMLFPLAIGWLRIKGERANLFQSEEGVLLVAIAYTVCFLTLIWFTSRSVNKIDRKRSLYEEALKKSYARLEILSEISSRLLISDDPQMLVNELCKRVMRFLDCQVFFNFLVDDIAGKLHMNTYSGIPSEKAQKIEWLDFGVAVCGCVAQDGKRIIAENIPETDDIRTELIRSFGIKAYACHPLLAGEKVLGTLSFGTTKRVSFNDDELSMMKTVAGQVAIAMSRIKNEKELRESEDRFKLLTTNTPDHILVQDADLRYSFVLNPQLGLKEDQMIGKTDYEILTEADAALITKIKKGVLETGKPEYVNIPLLSSNGEYQYFEGMYVAKHNKQDQIDGIIGYFRNITERKKMEDALQESEENLWSVLNATKESVYMFDREGKFTISNATGLRRLNKTDENDLLGHHFSEFVTAELAREIQSKLDKVVTTGEPLEFEDGRSGYVFHHNFYPVFKDKEVSKVVTYSTDITEQKKAEKELQRTKNYLESLINYANAPIIVWTQGNEIQLFNHAFERLTGYSSAEIVGEKLDVLFPEASLAESNAKIKLSLTENLQTIEIPILTSKNEIRTVLWNSANIYDNDNITVLSTIAQGNDITERIKAQTELSKSKEKLDIALESGNIGIWEWDIKENKFEWDKRMGKIIGSESGLANKRISDFEKHIYEDDVPHFRNTIHRTIKEEFPFELIYRIKHQNGEVSYISTRASIEKNKEGVPVKMTGVCFDITDMQKGTEQALFNLNEDLQRSNKELEQFAYVASHDLQEPLRMVSSFTQLLSMRYSDKLDKEAREFIKFAVDGASRMQNLINDLLEYSRIGTRGKSLSITDMNSILGQSLYNLRIKINEKAALVTNDELPTVSADGGQMVQLFQNLIGNALKFCTTSPRIHIFAEEEKDHYLFSVKDNGIGIEPEYNERIFQIFQRLHPREEYGGTGIGLAICRRIVERHEGKIWVESKPGEGAVFKFTIKKK